MSHDKIEAKLIYMANQIAGFFETQPADEAVGGVAMHINKFWEPRMRRQILALIDAGDSRLNALVLQAGASIRRPEPVAATQS